MFEDDPLFNAGKGAVFNAAGVNEMDAAIMDGKTLRAGTVANLEHVKNPITLARAVMEKSPHVMMAGPGAEAFAKEHGVDLVDAKYFFTQERWDELQRDKAKEKGGVAIRNLLSLTIPLARSRWIETGIWRRPLQPVANRINSLGALAIVR